MPLAYMVSDDSLDVIKFGSIVRSEIAPGSDKPRLLVIGSAGASMRTVGLFDLFSDRRDLWNLIADLERRGMHSVGHLEYKSPAQILGGVKLSFSQRAFFFERLKTSRSGELTRDYLSPPRR